MKKNLYMLILAVFMFAVLIPVRVWAAGRDGVRLDESGAVTVVSQHAAQEGICSMSFSMAVETEDTARVDFQFVEDTAEILEFRYDRDAGTLNVYMAGTEALFAEGTDSLAIGKIIVRDETGRETTARVSVVENSLQYVYGTELKTMEGLELPGTVQIGSASGTPGTPIPEEPDGSQEEPPDGSQEEPSDNAPENPVSSQAPAPAPTRPPAQTQAGVSRPQATKVPALPQTTGSALESPGNSLPATSSKPAPSGNSIPETTPEKEDEFIYPGSSDGEDTKQAAESKGFNVLLVISVIVIIIVVAVEIVAFVVVKKKPKNK